jgi:phage terminase small subunit
MAANIPTRPKRTRPVPGQQTLQDAPAPAPPQHLSPEARAKWTELAREWVLGFDALPLLQAGLEQWDSYQSYRKAAAKKPTFVSKTGNCRANPAHKMSLDALREFRMCFRALGLEPPKV